MFIFVLEKHVLPHRFFIPTGPGSSTDFGPIDLYGFRDWWKKLVKAPVSYVCV